MKKTVKKLPKSEVAVDVSIPQELFETYKSKAILKLGENVELAGFRKGKAPEHLLEQSLNPMHVLEEMAEISINEHLPKILIEEKIDAIGRPNINITKIAYGNPFEFTATFAVMPEVKMPDYKKIAKEENSKNTEKVEVTAEELETAIKELKRAREHQELEQSGAPHDHAEFEKKEFDAVLTEEEVKKFGPFESVEDFKEKFKQNLQREKVAHEHEKRRIAILEAIYKETEADLPTVLVNNEMQNLIERLKADIARSGLSFEDYLTHIKKTEEEIRKDFEPDAEKRAKMELILYKIMETEKLEADPAKVELETEALLGVYKDVDKARAKAYVTQLLMNEEVFKFLEAQK